MVFVEQVSADLVVACWLKAELFSLRFRSRVEKALKHVRLPPRAVAKPNLTSPAENLLRQQALHLYRKDTWGILPQCVQWWRATITPQEFRQLRVINYPTWTLLSRDTGRLSVAAAVVARGTVPRKAKGRWANEAGAVITHVRELQDQLHGTEIQSQLILVGRPGRKPCTILEGNKRATAFYIRCFLTNTEAFPPSMRVFVGLTARSFSRLRTA